MAEPWSWSRRELDTPGHGCAGTVRDLAFESLLTAEHAYLVL